MDNEYALVLQLPPFRPKCTCSYMLLSSLLNFPERVNGRRPLGQTTQMQGQGTAQARVQATFASRRECVEHALHL
eukprot:12467511-Alexandrium_andersonii.AAC.1